jgi:hypothetical protein
MPGLSSPTCAHASNYETNYHTVSVNLSTFTAVPASWWFYPLCQHPGDSTRWASILVILPAGPASWWFYPLSEHPGDSTRWTSILVILPTGPASWWFYPLCQHPGDSTHCASILVILPTMPASWWFYPLGQPISTKDELITFKVEENTWKTVPVTVYFDSALTNYNWILPASTWHLWEKNYITHVVERTCHFGTAAW